MMLGSLTSLTGGGGMGDLGGSATSGADATRGDSSVEMGARFGNIGGGGGLNFSTPTILIIAVVVIAALWLFKK